MGVKLSIWSFLNCGCQKSTIKTSLKSVPLCHTSCSKLSSNTMNLPSIHWFVLFPTRINAPSGILRPRCARRRQLVGPQCGHTWTCGYMTENLTWPRLHVFAAANLSISLHVIGARLQFLSSFFPRAYKVNCCQSPFSLRFSSSETNDLVFESSRLRPSSLISIQCLSIS
jgi:hypothetical protein